MNKKIFKQILLGFFGLLILIILLPGCAFMHQYNPMQKSQTINGVTINILDAYWTFPWYGIGIRIENNSGKLLNLKVNKAIIILDSGESLPAYTASEMRDVTVRNINIESFRNLMAYKLKTTKILESGLLPTNSWREGLLFFMEEGKSQNYKLILDDVIEGIVFEAITLQLGKKVKIKNVNENNNRTFLGTPR